MMQRTIASQMARPLIQRMCTRGCGMPTHRGACKGPARFEALPGAVRTCGRGCGRRLADSNPGPLCRLCQVTVLEEGIAKRELEAERPEKKRTERLPPLLAMVEENRADLLARRQKQRAVATIRIDAIPQTAENRLESEIGELYGRLLALPDGQALVVPRDNKKEIRNTCERLRTRLTRGNAGRLRWKRDGLTLYIWREPLDGAD